MPFSKPPLLTPPSPKGGRAGGSRPAGPGVPDDGPGEERAAAAPDRPPVPPPDPAPETGDLQQLNHIFEARLRRRRPGRSSTLTANERAILIERFGGVLRRLSKLMNIRIGEDGTPSLDVVLHRLMDIITEALRADRSTLFLFDRDSGELFSRVAQGGLVGEIRLAVDEGIAGAVFTTGEPIIIEHAYADRRFNREVDRRTGYRTRNVLCVPVTSWDGQIMGVTQVLNKLSGPFDEEDLALLEALTSHASALLESARLQENVEKARRDELQLLGVTQALTSELHLDALLEKIVAITTDVLEAERTSLFLHDRQADELWSKVAEGLDVDVIRFPANVGLAGSVFTSGQVVNIPDAYEDPRFNPGVDRRTGFRTRSILCAPVVNRQGSAIGVIQVLNKRGGPFAARDERRLQALAAQAAVALDNARLFEEVLSERNFKESILRTLSSGVVTLDAAGRVVTANAAALRILARTAPQLVSRRIGDVLGHGESRIAAAVERVTASRSSEFIADADIDVVSGRRVSANITVEPLDSAATPSGSLLIIDDISSEKRFRTTMSRYMPHEVVNELLNDGEAILGGVTQTATVLFADIGDFTTLSERLGARATVSVLNEYFSAMTDVIFRHGGIVDKYIGDAIMAVFGAPFAGEEDADNAVRSAIEMMSRLDELNARNAALGRASIATRIGISTGEVVAGNIGSPKRMDYTVIGDPVNVAARLEGANKVYGSRVLASASTVAALRSAHAVRELDRVRIRGCGAPVTLYEILDGTGSSAGEQGLAAFAEGLRLYRAGRWAAARSRFEAALRARPQDGPARRFRARCEELLRQAPLPGWDGVFEMAGK